MKTIRDIPVLPGGGWDGHAGEFRRSRGAIFLRAIREGGDLCAIRFFNVPILVISSPELVHEFLSDLYRYEIRSLRDSDRAHALSDETRVRRRIGVDRRVLQ